MPVPSAASDTDHLLQRAQAGDRSAEQALLARFRDRLKRMIAALLDPRLAPRIDASDIVQETLTVAHDRLPEYLRTQPVAFYPWLRAIAKGLIVDAHRRHIVTERRSVAREEHVDLAGSAFSTWQLAARLASRESSPSRQISKREATFRIQVAMEGLASADRELLTMRFVEQLTVPEIAQILAVSESAARGRLRRALERIGRKLS